MRASVYAAAAKRLEYLDHVAMAELLAKSFGCDCKLERNHKPVKFRDCAISELAAFVLFLVDRLQDKP